MVVSSSYTASERNLAKAFDIDLRIMGIEEALETQWLPIARAIFSLSIGLFTKKLPQVCIGYRKTKRLDTIIEAIEEIPFDEWLSLVQYAIQNHPTEASDFLWFVARHHYDDSWRFNALQELISADLIRRFDVKQILESEQDLEILEMLHEYGYS